MNTRRQLAAIMVCGIFAIVVFAMVFSPVAFATDAAQPFSDFMDNLIATGQGIAGTIAVVFIIFGAIKLKAASGNPVAQQAAKATIVLAIGGLLVAVFAREIVALVQSWA